MYGVTNEELKVLWRGGSLQLASLKVSKMCIIWWVILPLFTGKTKQNKTKTTPKQTKNPTQFIYINKRQNKALIRISLIDIYVRQWEQHYWSVPNIRQKEEGKTSGRGEISTFLLSFFFNNSFLSSNVQQYPLYFRYFMCSASQYVRMC